jgi:hypothetical protein
MAAYITYSVDPSLIDYYDAFSKMEKTGVHFMAMMETQKQQLDSLLAKSNKTILQLFTALAIT